jgi:hypothetical protein
MFSFWWQYFVFDFHTTKAELFDQVIQLTVSKMYSHLHQATMDTVSCLSCWSVHEVNPPFIQRDRPLEIQCWPWPVLANLGVIWPIHQFFRPIIVGGKFKVPLYNITLPCIVLPGPCCKIGFYMWNTLNNYGRSVCPYINMLFISSIGCGDIKVYPRHQKRTEDWYFQDRCWHSICCSRYVSTLAPTLAQSSTKQSSSLKLLLGFQAPKKCQIGEKCWNPAPT